MQEVRPKAAAKAVNAMSLMRGGWWKSGGEAEAVLHLDGVQGERCAEQARGEALCSHAEHAVSLPGFEDKPFMLDGLDAGTDDEEVHKEVLRFDWIIRAMGVHPEIVLGMDDVFDVKFGEHGGGWLSV